MTKNLIIAFIVPRLRILARIRVAALRA